MKLVELSLYRMRMLWKKFEKVSSTLSRTMLTNQDISTCDHMNSTSFSKPAVLVDLNSASFSKEPAVKLKNTTSL